MEKFEEKYLQNLPKYQENQELWKKREGLHVCCCQPDLEHCEANKFQILGHEPSKPGTPLEGSEFTQEEKDALFKPLFNGRVEKS